MNGLNNDSEVESPQHGPTDPSREDETEDLRRQLAEERQARQEAEEQLDSVNERYNELLGRVTHIRTSLGGRIKADAEELAQTKAVVEELEDQNRQLNDAVSELTTEKDGLNRELGGLRTRLNLAQQNWSKERDELVTAERHAREVSQAMKQTMQDWEVLAIEERSTKENLSDRVIELEEQLAQETEGRTQLQREADRLNGTVEDLQRALQEIQEARRKELRELVENSQAQIDTLTQKCATLETRCKEAEQSLASTTTQLEHAAPFEKEVREKNLLIGKLRHEAVTLNDHLRKALRMLKRDNADDKIDKQLVTNLFLQFVSIQRGDARKYEVLQLISSVLDWDDEQKEKAGLLRPGAAAASSAGSLWGGTNSASTTNLKTPPLTPFHRSPSTPQLGSGDAYDGSKDMWTTVLEAEK